ncbi:MAG TPA: PP2C family protein-serine/threonine phosphatase [Bryobacteraceae bacterium]|nr:PP2C family protein-serine/threonine phosphatase [Bryobacteraceae bacterium]
MGTPRPLPTFDESQLARAVQNRIYPSMRPSIPGLDYYSDWRPAAGAASDYLDYFEMEDGHLGLAIGDVSAQGVEAALLTSALHSIVRALRFSPGRNVADLVSNIDELFSEICPDNCYATLFFGRYDPILGRLHYVNAGHEPPFVLRKKGTRHRNMRLESGGPWLGMLRKSAYREGVVALEPGDLLVAYTDGLCEATNAQGEEFGWRRFLDCLESGTGRRARELVEEVFTAADEFTAGAPQLDDMTLWLGHIEEVHALPILQLMDHCEEPAAA